MQCRTSKFRQRTVGRIGRVDRVRRDQGLVSAQDALHVRRCVGTDPDQDCTRKWGGACGQVRVVSTRRRGDHRAAQACVRAHARQIGARCHRADDAQFEIGSRWQFARPFHSVDTPAAHPWKRCAQDGEHPRSDKSCLGDGNDNGSGRVEAVGPPGPALGSDRSVFSRTRAAVRVRAWRASRFPGRGPGVA